MPRLDQVEAKNKVDVLHLRSLPWVKEAVGPGIILGGSYLLAGEPGIGKTTLGLQMLIDLANQGYKVLYITTEQSVGDLKRTVERILRAKQRQLNPEKVGDNLYLEDNVDDIETLPNFLAKRILADGEEYHGCKVIVFDSIQGQGLSAGATHKYKALYQFMDITKSQGIITFLVGHITKKGQIAGPKDLEHYVDCVIYIRRAFTLRPLFVPKNRFWQARLEPLVLVMDKTGQLTKAPLATAQSSMVYGYGGMGDEFAEAQAVVSLPKFGSRPELNAPYLPKEKVKQILGTLSNLKDVDVSNLSYEINCFIPRRQRYTAELDLPLAVSLLSSYLQQPVAPGSLFVGEVDLMKKIRAPEPSYLASFVEVFVNSPSSGKINKLYISGDAASTLKEMMVKGNVSLEVQLVSDLEELVTILWPKITSKK